MTAQWSSLIPGHFQACIAGFVVEIESSADGSKWFGRVDGHRLGRRSYKTESAAKKWTEKNAKKLLEKKERARLKREMQAGGAVI